MKKKYKFQGLLVTNDKTSTFTEFSTYTKATEFIGKERTYLFISISKKDFYKEYGFSVKKII